MEKYMLKISKLNKVVTTMKVTMLCIEPISKFLAYISQYLFPHSMDSSNSFCIIFLLSHSFIPSIQIFFTLLIYVTVSQFRIF